MDGREFVTALWEKNKAKRLKRVNVSKVLDFLVSFNNQKEKSGVPINFPQTRVALDYLMQLNIDNIEFLDSQVFKMERRLAGIPPPKEFKIQVQQVMDKLNLKPGRFQYDKNAFPLIEKKKPKKRSSERQTERPKRTPLKQSVQSRTDELSSGQMPLDTSFVHVKDIDTPSPVHSPRHEELRNTLMTGKHVEHEEGNRQIENSNPNLNFLKGPENFEQQTTDSAFDDSIMPIDSLEFPNFSTTEVSNNCEQDNSIEKEDQIINTKNTANGSPEACEQSFIVVNELHKQIQHKELSSFSLSVVTNGQEQKDNSGEAPLDSYDERDGCFSTETPEDTHPVEQSKNILSKLESPCDTDVDVDKAGPVDNAELKADFHSSPRTTNSQQFQANSNSVDPLSDISQIFQEKSCESDYQDTNDIIVKARSEANTNKRSQIYEMSKQGYVRCSPAFGFNGRYGESSYTSQEDAIIKLTKEVKRWYQGANHLKKKRAIKPVALCLRSQEEYTQFRNAVLKKHTQIDSIADQANNSDSHKIAEDSNNMPIIASVEGPPLSVPIGFVDGRDNGVTERTYNRESQTKAFLKDSEMIERPIAAGYEIEDLSLDPVMRQGAAPEASFDDAFSFSNNIDGKTTNNPNKSNQNNTADFLGSVEITNSDGSNAESEVREGCSSFPSSVGSNFANRIDSAENSLEYAEKLIQEQQKQDQLMEVWRKKPIITRDNVKPIPKPVNLTYLNKNTFLDPLLKDNLNSPVFVGPYLPDGSQRSVFGLPYYDKQYSRFMYPDELSNFKRRKSVETIVKNWIDENEFSYFDEILDYFSENHSEMKVSEGEVLYTLGDLTEQGFIELSQHSSFRALGAIFVTKTGDSKPFVAAANSEIKQELID